MPGAIIVGASSGIGAALARELDGRGYTLGLVARRENLLESLRRELRGRSFIKRIDIAEPDDAASRLRELIADMGDVELYVLNAGVGFPNPELSWAPEATTIQINVVGFAAMANVAFAALRSRGSGQIVGISSIAALRGGRHAPAYNASKAFVSNYLEGLRHFCVHHRLPIAVTDIQPGFVDTAMAKSPNLFWVAPAQKAARQIDRAIVRRRAHAYVTRRWRLLAWLIKCVPRALYERT
jgi:short-subunit dehydrogenase